jgi:hypothetical protein
MFDAGMTNKEVKATLEIGFSTTTTWRALWRNINIKGIKMPIEYYKELYPDLSDVTYQALADGKIKTSIIRRNFL